MVMPLLRHLVETVIVPSNTLPKACASFLALCDVLDLWLWAKNQRSCDGLVQQMRCHLNYHIEAYGTEHVKPKHHYSFHNAESICDSACVLDCFVHERKHQTLKQEANFIKRHEDI